MLYVRHDVARSHSSALQNAQSIVKCGVVVQALSIDAWNGLTEILTGVIYVANMADRDVINAASAKFPKPADIRFQYGTAGVSAPFLSLKDRVIEIYDL